MGFFRGHVVDLPKQLIIDQNAARILLLLSCLQKFAVGWTPTNIRDKIAWTKPQWTKCPRTLPGRLHVVYAVICCLVDCAGNRVHIRHLSVNGLLPDTDDYVTYDGSLTQPGCQETVTWIIINKPIYISNEHVRWPPVAACPSSLALPINLPLLDRF